MNRSPRVRMLASVRSAEEALFALNAGADLIDAKEPSGGTLGAVPIATLREIVADVAGRRPVSATAGDLPMQLEPMRRAVDRTAACGVDFVKVGFFDLGEPAERVLELPRLAPQVPLIAVLFVDLAPPHPPQPPLQALAGAGWHGVMLDTVRKAGGSLRDWTDDGWLAEFVGQARAAGLLVGLAGSLGQRDIRPLARLGADYLGFRGALCAEAHREACLDPIRVRAVRAELDRAAAEPPRTHQA
jgi:(5-formylfuran-3-yl)methyl phosphate synthase